MASLDRMGFFDLLFGGAPEGALIEIATGNPPTARRYLTVLDLLAYDPPRDRDAYFGPAVRKRPGAEKTDVLSTRVLWVDIDRPEPPVATLLPSIVVRSGHGHHLYWLLEGWVDDVTRIEEANQALAVDLEADHSWNANRVLRIPGTRNFRGESPVDCEVRRAFPERVYRLEDFSPLSRLDAKTRHKVRTGDRRGYRSRSERDWAVVCALVDAGADDALVRRIFSTQPIGDKYRERNGGAGGDKYLDRTTSKARDRKPGAGGTASTRTGEIVEHEDGYYVRSGRAVRRASTFTLLPRLLLGNIDSGPNSEDAILGTVRASGYEWKDVAFTRSAFNSVAALQKQLPKLAWQWLGNDNDARALLPFVLGKLQELGLPQVAATGVLGLHTVGGRPCFVGDSATIGVEEVWPGATGPMVYLETKREHPKLLVPGEGPVSKVVADGHRAALSVLSDINAPEVFWPILGWYAATPLKPAFESLGHRFPVLNVHGTRGSGKTTTIQRVMMPLLGQLDPRSYDANTTRFVILSLLGSSNAVPVAFSEFRFGAADKFLRYVLLSYDTGHDPRGRADQTTVDYPLSAPFSVDGEDLIADPAAKERIIPVTMRPATIAEGSDANRALVELRRIGGGGRLAQIGSHYLQFCLQVLVDGRFDAHVTQARNDILAAFPQRLPDRVRSNFTVAWVGVRLFCEFAARDTPDCRFLGESLRTCYDVERGRAATFADEMVEDLVNAAASPRGGSFFTWRYDPATRTFWFQLASSHSWWLYQRRRQNRGSLERDAIRNQLIEAPFVTGPIQKEGTWMYGVSLIEAQAQGLDVPDSVDQATFHL